MSVHVDKRGRVFVAWRENGKQKRKLFKTQREAISFDAGKRGGATTRQLWEKFKSYLELNNRGKKYIGEIKSVLDRSGLMERPADSPDFDWFNQRYSTTKNRYLSYMKIMYAYGVRKKMLKENPLADWKKTKEKPRDLNLTVEDLQKIVDAAAPHLKVVLLLLYATGARLGEVLTLKWLDIDFDSGMVRIWSKKTKDGRTVPVSRELLDVLGKFERTSPYVITYKGHRVTRIQTAWETAVRKAGLNYKPVPYEIRHLFATCLLTSGGDLAAVSKMLGHSTVKMTADVYYQFLESEKVRTASLLKPLLSHSLSPTAESK